MKKGKELIKIDDNQPRSTIGYFHTEDQIQKIINDLPKEEQEIFVPAYKSLALMNQNMSFNLPNLRAYAHEMARYFTLTYEAGEETTIDINNGKTEMINPLLTQADKHLTKALVLSQRLGLDSKSRQQIIRGPEKEKPEEKGVSEFKKNYK